MRVITLLGTLTVLCGVSTAAVGASPDIEVTLVRDNVKVSVQDPSVLSEKLVRLMESCSVNSTVYVRPKDRWKRALAAPSYIHVRFTPARRLRVWTADDRGWAPSVVREILLVLPSGAWPDHVLLKGETGTLSVTKYSPYALKALVIQPALDLSAVPPYDRLLKLGAGE